MGKKKKHKIKKLLRAQAAAQEKELAKAKTEELTEAQPEQLEQSSKETVEVKKDIKKILITIGLLVVIIIAIYLINIKTDFILQLGEWISQTLNINV